MKIIADENIPLLYQFFGESGEVVLLPGKAITADVVCDADALLVRSVTKVDAHLLQKSTVKFVATATAGTDHVDLEWLQERKIGFAHAPGSNAESVVEYVLAALLYLSTFHETELRGKTVGVIGIGEIGKRLVPRLEAMGCTVLQNDPPRALTEAGNWTSLEDLLQQSDVVTFHVPMVKQQPFSTHYILNHQNIHLLKKGAWLVQASRGGIVEEAALKTAAAQGQIGALVLDVWENEPFFDPDLAAMANLATPHIAGYSHDGKVNGTKMIYQAFLSFFKIPHASTMTPAILAAENFTLDLPIREFAEVHYLQRLTQKMYPILEDDKRFRELIWMQPEQMAAAFHKLRKNYPVRHAFGHYGLSTPVPRLWRAAISKGLCMKITDLPT